MFGKREPRDPSGLGPVRHDTKVLTFEYGFPASVRGHFSSCWALTSPGSVVSLCHMEDHIVHG